MTLEEPDKEQWWAAVRSLLAVLRVQTEAPGTISPDRLPGILYEAADEWDRQGDYGAARLLEEWAQMLGQTVEDDE